jgi:hypothetical protein
MDIHVPVKSNLNFLQNRLSKSCQISKVGEQFLSKTPTDVHSAESQFARKDSLTNAFYFYALEEQAAILQNWFDLLNLAPGNSYARYRCLVIAEYPLLFCNEIIIITRFSPSIAHHLNKAERSCELWFKGDNTAIFWLPTLKDAETFPELYDFKGSWKEAYLLLLKVWQRNWPIEEFSEELLKFLLKK